jgi:hypothetical protein
MSSLPRLRSGLVLASLSLLLATGPGCDSGSGDPAAKACCQQPEIPAGVAPFTILEEETTGSSDGQRVLMRVALGRPVKRDELYPVLHTLYRHAMTRGPFEPIHFVADVYPSEATARSGGDTQLLGRISREQSQRAPQCENRVGYDFAEQVDRAFGASLGSAKEENIDDSCKIDKPKVVARFDEKFTHKPSYKLDPASKSVEISYPYLESGKDEYRSSLKLTSALAYWIEFVSSLFQKVPDLQMVNFAGIHDDTPVLRISINRQQYDADFSSLQETIAAHSAVTFQTLGTGRSSEKAAEQEQETFKLKTYKEALAALPKAQVTISPQLAKGKIEKKDGKAKAKAKGKLAKAGKKK